jgi:hypothetical protein
MTVIWPALKLQVRDDDEVSEPYRPRTVYGSLDETRYRRHERTKGLAAWHEMLLDRFAETPEDELMNRLAASQALAGPELTFLRARIAERRGDVAQAATLATECLKETARSSGGTWTSPWKSARNCRRAPASCYPSAPGS